VSDLELERKELPTRAEVAKRMSVFADALAKGNKVELDLGGTSLTLRVAGTALAGAPCFAVPGACPRPVGREDTPVTSG
jgi:hypothetical protein